ncbi:MAG: hypothetical protein KJ970_10480 [Candidatus Eisenbacteria bacterium]|uniref:6-bladed beta-propeller n=1 Tax=Eiseniibacteriota bacterium TaxID=2212470 RepID=A0A948S019_UNCEI|nr:hypothetical protein [Candidatus Eisenbacteria bacterium]MBU1950113.1 hypothetical protein [Candidatus Eisenbacteria bacterium]MBU2691339.1 hypothetical protein [Candidatus Eisenbacteria bacterium]
MLKRRVNFLMLGIFVILAGPAFAGKETTIDGVLHIQNSASPSQGVKTVNLEEVWRIGGEDEEILFGLISKICGDSDGNVYVLDAQLCHVHIYSPTGELLKTLFRQGEGPGEVQGPRDMLLMPDGSVACVEEFPGKITMVDMENNPKGSLIPGSEKPTEGGFTGLTAAAGGGDHIVISGEISKPGDTPGTQKRIYFLSGFKMSGEETANYMTLNSMFDFNNFTFIEKEHTPSFWWGFGVDANGRTYVYADRDQYAITVFSPDGKVERIIERAYEPLKREQADTDRLRRLYESAVANPNLQVSFDLEETEPAIAHFQRGLQVTPDGQLWVLTSRGCRHQPQGIIATYDHFDAGGHFIEQVSFAGEGNGLSDTLFFLGNRRVVLVTGFIDALAAQFGSGTLTAEDDEEASPQQVICYRLPE